MRFSAQAWYKLIFHPHFLSQVPLPNDHDLKSQALSEYVLFSKIFDMPASAAPLREYPWPSATHRTTGGGTPQSQHLENMSTINIHKVHKP